VGSSLPILKTGKPILTPSMDLPPKELPTGVERIYLRNVCIFYAQNPTFAVLILVAMLAVVKIAGQQFKVQEGQSLYVPHLPGKTGDKVEFSEVLFTDNSGKISAGDAVKAIVKAEIMSDLVQGDKVIAFKMKRRKGFRKKHGHRTHYTRIKIESIA
jgi:large subunit ribosomal protein L21